MIYVENMEPIFIPTSEELSLFEKEKYESLSNKFTKSQIECGFSLLKHILYKRYGDNYSMDVFINDTENNYQESELFSKNIIDIFNDKKWSINTKKSMFYIIKNILKITTISDTFINRLNISHKNPVDKFDCKNILKRDYYQLPDEHPTKKRLMEWVTILRIKSNNNSPSTLKTIIAFYINSCLTKLGITLEPWDISSFNLSEKIVNDICVNTRYFSWLKLFCEEILNVPFNFETPHLHKDFNTYYSGDKHTMTPDELDKIYNQTKLSSYLDQLIFLLLITTGMRVGGLTNIKLSYICNATNNIEVFDSGRTLEKGHKWFEFIITDDVKRLIISWMVHERKGNSEFLFPSSVTKSGHISANTVRSRFKKICEHAHLRGEHLHLHSLRHTYAHILLNCGNDISVISKLLNHSNTDTTEKFYLKESISQIVERANIPWLLVENKKEKLPKFLLESKSVIGR